MKLIELFFLTILHLVPRVYHPYTSYHRWRKCVALTTYAVIKWR